MLVRTLGDGWRAVMAERLILPGEIVIAEEYFSQLVILWRFTYMVPLMTQESVFGCGLNVQRVKLSTFVDTQLK